MTNKEAKEKIFYQWQDFLEHNLDYAGISDAYKMALKALEQADVLQEIRQEIEQIKATAIYSTIDLKDMVLAIINKHMEEHHD